MELIHKSSMLVDDYVDKDGIRNGEESFHVQYHDVINLILLANAMQAAAQANFRDCQVTFSCDNGVTADNMKKLAQIIYDVSQGRYREILLADYEYITLGEIEEINSLETVSFFEESIGLGYSCFHKFQGTAEHMRLKELGKQFGRFYQYINDLQPFSQKENYEKYKGGTCNLGRKNIVLWTLYQCIKEDGRVCPKEYKEVMKLYDEYEIEEEILETIRGIIEDIKKSLEKLEPGNEQWVKDFKEMFNYILNERGWNNKIPVLL